MGNAKVEASAAACCVGSKWKIRTQGRARLSLAVNKGNTDSIAVHRKSGHVVRKEAVFENGYVMANRLLSDVANGEARHAAGFV